jgi:hypothetical protein
LKDGIQTDRDRGQRLRQKEKAFGKNRDRETNKYKDREIEILKHMICMFVTTVMGSSYE